MPVTNHNGMRLHDRFPRYSLHAPVVPIWCVTPGAGRCIHRFFDTSPFSPSGRYLAVFRLPDETKPVQPGDVGHVVLIDLHEGTERQVATTRGWEAQMGCNLNWAGDDHLVFNDVDPRTWQPQIVKLNPHNGEVHRWPGGVYQVSPDGRWAAAASMEKMRRTQLGYGVMVPDERSRRNIGAVNDDGLFITDLQTGERRLLLSLADAVKAIPELHACSERELNQWEIYGFHSKWSPQGDRLIFTIRRYLHQGLDRFDAMSRGDLRFDVLTLRPDGSDVHDAVSADKWEYRGHHINFFPDGRKLSMNLGYFRGGDLDLTQVNCDGSELKAMTRACLGSGHPTVHPDGRHVLTDTYTDERWTHGGTTPLRWIDLRDESEIQVARIRTQPDVQPDVSYRIDPHPAWDRTWRWIAFNAFHEGTRRVFVADMSSLLA